MIPCDCQTWQHISPCNFPKKRFRMIWIGSAVWRTPLGTVCKNCIGVYRKTGTISMSRELLCSYNRSLSSWAFAVTFFDGPECCVLGYQAGRVEVDQSRQAFFGSSTHSAQQGEIEALVWSSWWIIRWLWLTGWKGPIEFCWDSTTAGGKASGAFNAGDPAGILVRQLHQALEMLVAPNTIQHTHVRAHTGIIYNELVDAAAKWALTAPDSWADMGQFQQLRRALGNSLDWMWTYFLPRDSETGFVPTGISRAWTGTYTDEDVQLVIDEMVPGATNSKQALRTVTYTLRLASYNVLSVKDPVMEEAPGIGKVALLRDQFSQGKYHIAGLQETRNKSGMVVSNTHVRFCSGTNAQGHFGTELWFSLDIPFACDRRGKPHFFSKTDFVVLHSDPRVLVVHCKNRILEFVAICAHSPHSGAPTEDRRQWWADLQAVCDIAPHDTDTILFIDATARLHTSIPGIVGSLTAFQRPTKHCSWTY